MKVSLNILVVFALFTVGCQSPTEKSATSSCPNEWQGNFMFFQMADTQLGAGDYDFNISEFERAIEYANKHNPDFVVICGDLIGDPFRDNEKDDFKRVAAKLKKSIPLHLVAGNHDVGKEPTLESLDWFRKYFGKDYYSFEHKSCVCLVLNSSLIRDPKHVPEEHKKQKEWMLKKLKDAQESNAKHIFIFQHHPYFHRTIDEEVEKAYTCMPDHKKEYFEIFHKYGVRAVFAGHFHRNVEGRDGDIEMITTGRLGGRSKEKSSSGFRIVHVFEDAIKHVYFETDEMPEKIEPGKLPEFIK